MYYYLLTRHQFVKDVQHGKCKILKPYNADIGYKHFKKNL